MGAVSMTRLTWGNENEHERRVFERQYAGSGSRAVALEDQRRTTGVFVLPTMTDDRPQDTRPERDLATCHAITQRHTSIFLKVSRRITCSTASQYLFMLPSELAQT